jgi:photosynthetic reaction center H subunit
MPHHRSSASPSFPVETAIKEVAMSYGIFSGHNDLAVWVLYAFWIFFAGLIYYLHRENKREGYPLVPDTGGRGKVVEGFPFTPSPKTFKLLNGSSIVVDGRPDTRPIAAKAIAPWPGAPLEPTGDPMKDGVGPAAYAVRRDTADTLASGAHRLLPLRVATDFYPDPHDSDPRGMDVVGADGKVAGKVVDLWIDRAEYMMRYLEVEVAENGRRVLLPAMFSDIKGSKGCVVVEALLARHFADVPGLKKPDEVTLLEEDMICGYYGGGTLYAVPSRSEPLI